MSKVALTVNGKPVEEIALEAEAPGLAADHDQP